MNPEIEKLKRSVSRHTRMEIPLRDVVDMLIPKFINTIEGAKNYNQAKAILEIFNAFDTYLSKRLEHRKVSRIQEATIAYQMWALLHRITERLGDYV